jgi:hypothetical protein
VRYGEIELSPRDEKLYRDWAERNLKDTVQRLIRDALAARVAISGQRGTKWGSAGRG